MKTIIRVKCFTAILLTFLFLFSGKPSVAQEYKTKDLILPISGKIMLVGSDKISSPVGAAFAFLAGGKNGKLVILNNAAGLRMEIFPQWHKLIGDVTVITLDKSKNTMTKAELETLRSATAVWLADDLSKNLVGLQLGNELKDLLLRDGGVGGQGVAAESIATLVTEGESIRDGFNLLTNSCISTSINKKKTFAETLNSIPGRVGWKISPKAAVVIHNSRQISVIGYSGIILRTAANGEWPERVAAFGPGNYVLPVLPFTTDLISWNRSGLARLGKIFPPSEAPVPEVPKGALLIIGGNGSPEGMWEKVVSFAGGIDAHYVCLSQTEDCSAAEKLKSLGCTNVAIHVVKTGFNGIDQGSDPSLLRDLGTANAVYFGGGRTYKFMDAYLDTPAQKLMKGVLDRGGIILGTSAGAQIQGDFLLRGDPRTNDTVWMEGNDKGLGFIQGVIIDAHFRQRGRENILPSLLVKFPQMLGIGIDESTAIWVQDTIAEVLGPHLVTFYDLKNSKNQDASSVKVGDPVILKTGEKYDLKNRKRIK